MFLEIYVQNYILKLPTGFAEKENIFINIHDPAKRFNGVCEIPNSHWARVGATLSSETYYDDDNNEICLDYCLWLTQKTS